LHDAERGGVFLLRDGDEAIEADALEGVASGGAGGFCGDAVAPVALS